MSSFRKEFTVTPTQILLRKKFKYISNDTNYKNYCTRVILILLCVILGAIIILNHGRYSREEKSSTSTSNIHIKERIKVESKSRRLTAAQTKEGQYELCIKKVDKLLHNFVNALIFNPEYQDLYSIVRQLKCVFLKLNANKSLPENHLACENAPSTELGFKSQTIIIDWNLKNHDALERYIIIINEILDSLYKIMKMEENVQRKSYANVINNVEKDLLPFRNTMQNITKGYIECGSVPDKSKTKLNVFLEFDNEVLIRLAYKAEERAGNVFKQMEKLFYTIKEDMIHRRKCTNQS